VLSLHRDISTVTGEAFVVLTLAEPPLTAKRRTHSPALAARRKIEDEAGGIERPRGEVVGGSYGSTFGIGTGFARDDSGKDPGHGNDSILQTKEERRRELKRLAATPNGINKLYALLTGNFIPFQKLPIGTLMIETILDHEYPQNR
jgi:hypothetical protein